MRVFHTLHWHLSPTDYSSTHQILKRRCELLIPINVCRSELSAGRGGANERRLNAGQRCDTLKHLTLIINPVMIIKTARILQARRASGLL